MSEAAKVKRQGATVVCTVTFTPEQVKPAEMTALQELGRAVKVKGFRPGKVPEDFVREKVDADRLLEETIRALLPQTFDALMKEHDIKPIITPQVETVTREPLTVEITFVEKPEVKLKNLNKLTIEKKEAKVDVKDVDRMVEYVMKQYQKEEKVDRAAQTGDQVTMDFWGADEKGEEIPAIRTTAYQVVIGSKTLLPGFEDNLIGMKVGDEKSFPLTFPANYHAEELKNKPVTFHIMVRGVAEVKAPELTDAFVQENMDAPSVVDFRKRVEDSMRRQEDDIERQRREGAFFDALLTAVQVDLPQPLLSAEVRGLFEEFTHELEHQKLTLADWMKRSKKEAADVDKEFKERAERRLKLRLGMQQLLEEKKIEVDDAEMKTAIDQLLAPLSEAERNELSAAYTPGQNAYEQMKWQKKVEKAMDEFLK